MSLRSGISNNRVDFLNQLREDARPIDDLVAEACPTPDPVIVDRLAKKAAKLDQSFRFPWQLQPNTPPVDMKNIMFYARILTMLRKLGVRPPVQVETQGGFPSKIFQPGGRVVPVLTPAPEERKGYVRVANSESEIEMNVFSDQPGSLQDAAENMVPELRTTARDQVRYLWRRYNGFFRQAQTFPEPPSAFVISDVNIDEIQFEDEDEKDLAQMPAASFADIIAPAIVLTPDETQLRQTFKQRRQDALNRVALIAAELQRRFVWSKLSDKMKIKIKKLLDREERAQQRERQANENKSQSQYPPQVDDDEEDPWEDDDIEAELNREEEENLIRQRRRAPESPPETPPPRIPPTRSRQRRRWYLISRIAYFLLIPVGAILSGVAVHYNVEQTGDEDRLITLYRQLPDKHWFKQLPFRSWFKLVGLTNRQENFLLMTQVSNKQLLNFKEDVFMLWKIDQLLYEEKLQNLPAALEWFSVVKSNVNFRTKYASVLRNALDLNLPFTEHDFVYICNANSTAINAITNYCSQKNLIYTEDLAKEIDKAKADIATERLSAQRSNNFSPLINAFKKAMPKDQLFSPWQEKMLTLFRQSGFNEVLLEVSFKNFIIELEKNSHMYGDYDAILLDFLQRYQPADKDSELTLPFREAARPLAYNEDNLYGVTRQVLDLMKSYRNDGIKDQVFYDYVFENWDKRSAQIEHTNFKDAIAFLGLDEKTQLDIFALLSSFANGISNLLDTADDEFSSGSSPPDKLVGLPRINEEEDNFQLPDEKTTAPSGRRMLEANDFANAPFSRTARYAVLPIGLASFFILSVNGQKEYANVITIDRDRQEDNYAVTIHTKEVNSSTAEIIDRDWRSTFYVFTAFSFVAYALTRNSYYAGRIAGFIAAASPYTLNMGKTVLSSVKSLTFSRVAMIGAGHQIYKYGLPSVGQATADVGKGIQSAGIGLLLAAAAVGVLFVAVPSAKGVKRKIY